jgi:nicotinate-nucleotide adenylyltransferase
VSAGTTAVFGGSFDPPHVGHVLAVSYVLSVYPVDRLVVVPVYRHPFNKDLTDFSHRLSMCELAFRDLRRIEVSDIERQLGAQSRTLTTIEAMLARDAETSLRLVIGADVLADRDKWYRFDRIAELAPPIVLGRAGVQHPEAPLAVLPEVSSSEVRRRCAAGLAIEGLLPHVVAGYITQHCLYGAEG